MMSWTVLLERMRDVVESATPIWRANGGIVLVRPPSVGLM